MIPEMPMPMPMPLASFTIRVHAAGVAHGRAMPARQGVPTGALTTERLP